MKSLRLTGVSKRFVGSIAAAVDGLWLEVRKGEILVVLGPSGCGKTTLLRLIAGLERPDAGSVFIGEECVAGGGFWKPPEERRVGLVFQDYALFPHLTVLENVAFGLGRLSAAERRRRVLEQLDWLGLSELAGRYPGQLSGGQQQRVALARALAAEPSVLLLDEPLSSLDAELRSQMRREVHQLLKEVQATAVFVTHDQEEALALGDRLAIMNAGCLEQVGTPQDVFQAPQSPFVARFLGKADFLPARVTPGGLETELGLFSQPVDLPPGSPVELLVRPDDVEIAPDPSGQGSIEEVLYQGMTVLYTLRLDSGSRLRSLENHTCLYPAGSRVRVRLRTDHPLHWFQPVFSGPLRSEAAETPS